MPATINYDHRMIDPEEIQNCIKCGEEKPLKQFHKRRTYKLGHRTTCKECTRWSQVEAKYGLTREQYNSLLQQQNGVCAICKQPPGKHPLDVDHCHETGEVRGLLCNPCNSGIGLLNDDPDLLRKAIAALRCRW